MNSPPTGSLSASPDRGAAPLETLLALEGADADGDPLDWTLDFGDGSMPATGSTLPASVAHTYEAACNCTAVLTLRDQQSQVTYQATVEAFDE